MAYVCFAAVFHQLMRSIRCQAEFFVVVGVTVAVAVALVAVVVVVVVVHAVKTTQREQQHKN